MTGRAPLYAVLAAGAVSTFGNMIAVLAVPWFVLEMTGSAMLTGITAAATVLPTIISGALGGALVDRIGHRRTCVLADLGNAAAVAAIPLLHMTVGIALWQLLVLVFVGALLDLPSGTARLSLVPDLAARAGMPLERANSLMAALQRGAQLLGPLVAGALIASVGAAAALWLDAATFVVAAVAIATLVPRPERPGSIERVTYVEQLRRGARFLWNDRLVRLLLVTFAVTNLVASPVFAIGLPVYANRDLGSAVALGVMTVAVGAGSLAGAIGYASIARRVRRRPTFLFALGLGGTPLALLGLTTDFPVVLALLALVGIAAAPLNPLSITLIQERTPPHMRAQVIGAAIAVAWIAMPVGMLLAGALTEAYGVRVLFLAAGVTSLALVAVLLPLPILRELDATPVAATAPAGPPR